MTIYIGAMTNSSPVDVASRIEDLRKSKGLTVSWVSEASGIADKTLRRRLYGDPSQFTLAELSAVAHVLGTNAESLVASTSLGVAA